MSPNDVSEQVGDVFLNVIFAFNLHFELPKENLVMQALAEVGNVKVFTEKLMLLFNRGGMSVVSSHSVDECQWCLLIMWWYVSGVLLFCVGMSVVSSHSMNVCQWCLLILWRYVSSIFSFCGSVSVVSSHFVEMCQWCLHIRWSCVSGVFSFCEGVSVVSFNYVEVCQWCLLIFWRCVICVSETVRS